MGDLGWKETTTVVVMSRPFDPFGLWVQKRMMRKGMMGVFKYVAHQQIKQLQDGPALRAFLNDQGYDPPFGADPLHGAQNPLSEEALDEALADICLQLDERARWNY